MVEANLSLSGLGAVIVTLLLTVVTGLVLIGGYISCLARHVSWRKSHLFFYMLLSIVGFFVCVLIILVLYYTTGVARFVGMTKPQVLDYLDVISMIAIFLYGTLMALRLLYDGVRLVVHYLGNRRASS